MTLNNKNDSSGQKTPKFLHINEAASLLSISTATVRNWIKSGKIRALAEGRSLVFDEDEILSLKKEIESGASPRLKSRRNKKAIEGTYIPAEYVKSEEYQNYAEEILQLVNRSSLEINSPLILLEVALGLFVRRRRLEVSPQFKELSLSELASEGKLNLGSSASLFLALYDFRQKSSEAQLKILREIHRLDLSFISGEDLLGLLYMSLSNLNHRKTSGSYYTPSTLVDSLVDKSLKSLSATALPKIIDPCCGSGNFLIKLFLALRSQLLNDGLSMEEAETRLLRESLFAYDLDQTAVTLAKINLELLRESPETPVAYHIECRNTLESYGDLFAQNDRGTFDLVIGNPPWGYSYSAEEINLFKEKFTTAQASLESFCLFLEYGLSLLKPNGILSYVLPEALLNVRLHSPIRKLILETTEILDIELLGQQFSKVFTPTITLIVRNSEHSDRSDHEILVSAEDRIQSIPQRRFYENDMYIFNVKASNLDDQVIEHMKSLSGIQFLKGNADFALGIVTGNNKDWILPKPSPNAEPILKGNDLFKYNFYPNENYIVFEPQKFQQVAPEALYRAPEKLLYRFINQNLVFAYDNQQTLSLNSANVLIPHLPGYAMKYILAVLNSRAAQFFHSITFSSIKVLRKHIESIPIPPCDIKKQHVIIEHVDMLLAAADNTVRADLYEKIDAQVMELYNLNPQQRSLILEKFAEVKFLSR